MHMELFVRIVCGLHHQFRRELYERLCNFPLLFQFLSQKDGFVTSRGCEWAELLLRINVATSLDVSLPVNVLDYLTILPVEKLYMNRSGARGLLL